MPGSGPRCHDARHRLIAPLARRGTLLPPLHRHCPGNAEGAGNAGDHAKLSPSTAAATTKSRPRPSVRRRQPRPAHPRPKPPPHQIPIDPAHQPPRVPSWGAFGRRPQNRWIAHDRPASETLDQLRRSGWRRQMTGLERYPRPRMFGRVAVFLWEPLLIGWVHSRGSG